MRNGRLERRATSLVTVRKEAMIVRDECKEKSCMVTKYLYVWLTYNCKSGMACSKSNGET